MAETRLRMFVGDGEHDLELTMPLIVELERLAGAGVGAIFKRIVGGTFYATELCEVVRLALVGAGMDPKRAAEHCATWVQGRPFAETLPITIAILEAVWFGPTKPGATE